MGVRLFCGGFSSHICGEPFDLAGDFEFSAAHCARTLDLRRMTVFLDSGAFTDPPSRRLSPETALERQLEWERRTGELSGEPGWRSDVLCSYDLLIDETWVGGQKVKRRWGLREADRAVEETVRAAAYFNECRTTLQPRTLVLSCQGVDALQYRDCAAAVLRHCQPGDWLGLGGWCIMGRLQSYLPEFWRTLHLVLPLARERDVRHVHLFGVLWEPAVAGLLHLADGHGMTVSVDSAKPLSDAKWKTPEQRRQAGCRANGWRENVVWWRERLAHLRGSRHYREPWDSGAQRQLALFE